MQPVIYTLKPGRSIFLGGLGRIDYQHKNPNASLLFVWFGAVKPHLTRSTGGMGGSAPDRARFAVLHPHRRSSSPLCYAATQAPMSCLSGMLGAYCTQRMALWWRWHVAASPS